MQIRSLTWLRATRIYTRQLGKQMKYPVPSRVPGRRPEAAGSWCLSLAKGPPTTRPARPGDGQRMWTGRRAMAWAQGVSRGTPGGPGER